MGEFSPPLFLSPSSIMLMHRPQTPQPGFGSITLLQKFTPHFKILDPRLDPFTLKNIMARLFVAVITASLDFFRLSFRNYISCVFNSSFISSFRDSIIII